MKLKLAWNGQETVTAVVSTRSTADLSHTEYRLPGGQVVDIDNNNGDAFVFYQGRTTKLEKAEII